MAKKKSKTQKSKQNQKRKLNNTEKAKQLKETTAVKKEVKETKKVTPKEETKKETVNATKTSTKKTTSSKKSIKTSPKAKTTTIKKTPTKKTVTKKEEKPAEQPKVVEKPIENKPDKTKQLVDKDQIKYNVVLNKELEKTTKITKIEEKDISTKTAGKELKITFKDTYNKVVDKVKSLLSKTKKDKVITEKSPKAKYDEKQKLKKEKQNRLKSNEPVKPKNKVLRVLYTIHRNIHIAFNTLLIVTYTFLLIGLIRTNAFSSGVILYISGIVIFLSVVAIGYNKYISGKIFTLLITAGMALGIYNLQYTYDFVRNLNSNEYEYKIYYVVTFDNGRNKSIYNINNKKVGLLENNATNVEKILNIKLDSVNYIEYKDMNKMFSDFYNQQYRAVIVNENQYKYMQNKIEPGSRKVKILYEFKANGRK